jgi:hypothetical protein
MNRMKRLTDIVIRIESGMPIVLDEGERHFLLDVLKVAAANGIGINQPQSSEPEKPFWVAVLYHASTGTKAKRLKECAKALGLKQSTIDEYQHRRGATANQFIESRGAAKAKEFALHKIEEEKLIADARKKKANLQAKTAAALRKVRG